MKLRDALKNKNLTKEEFIDAGIGHFFRQNNTIEALKIKEEAFNYAYDFFFETETLSRSIWAEESDTWTQEQIQSGEVQGTL